MCGLVFGGGASSALLPSGEIAGLTACGDNAIYILNDLFF